MKFEACQICDFFICENCFKECNKCNVKICPLCLLYSYEAEGVCCSYCDLAYCKDCNSRLDSGEELCSCNHCRKSYCNSCRLRIYQEGGDHCIDCIRLLPHEAALVTQLRRLQQEVDCLEKENRELKLEIEHLTDKNK